MFQFLTGTFECTLLLKQAKNCPCIPTGVVYHLNPTLVLFQKSPVFLRMGSCPTVFYKFIRILVFPIRVPGTGRLEQVFLFPGALLRKRVIKIVLEMQKTYLRGAKLTEPLWGPLVAGSLCLSPSYCVSPTDVFWQLLCWSFKPPLCLWQPANGFPTCLSVSWF